MLPVWQSVHRGVILLEIAAKGSDMKDRTALALDLSATNFTQMNRTGGRYSARNKLVRLLRAS